MPAVLLGAMLLTAQVRMGAGACVRAAAEAPITLAPGQCAYSPVLAAVRRNHTGILLERNAVYRFAAEGQWFDSTIATDARGYSSTRARWYAVPVMFAATPIRRVPTASWFELIGEVPGGSKHFVRIGHILGSEWPADASGELVAFANDVNFMYGNNSGEVTLTVTRIR